MNAAMQIRKIAEGFELLNEGHVASVPGTAYEFSPYFRILTTTNEAPLTRAIRRITDAIVHWSR